MWMWLALSGPALAADCAAQTRAEEVGGFVEEAMLAFATLDEDGFNDASGRAHAALPCVSDVISPARAAAYHRMEGVGAFMQGDAESAQRSFSAALHIEPGYALSAKIAPEGGKLWRLYDGAKSLSVSAPVTIPVPSVLELRLDGAVSNQRIPELPVIWQVVANSKVSETAYVAAGQPVPMAPAVSRAEPAEVRPVEPDPVVAAVEPVKTVLDEVKVAIAEPEKGAPLDVTPPPVKPPKEKSGGGALWAGAGASAAVAGGLFATSVVTRMSFDDDPSAGKYYLTNGAYYGAVGALAVSVGFTGLALSGSF